MALYRLPQYGFYHEIFNDTSTNHVLAKIDMFTIGYMMKVDMIGHTILAANRFTAVFFPFRHGTVGVFSTNNV